MSEDNNMFVIFPEAGTKSNSHDRTNSTSQFTVHQCRDLYEVAIAAGGYVDV